MARPRKSRDDVLGEIEPQDVTADAVARWLIALNLTDHAKFADVVVQLQIADLLPRTPGGVA